VWKDQQVAEAAIPHQMVVVHADHEAYKQLVAQMRVHWVPCVIVAEGGAEVRRLERNVSREDHIKFLRGEPIVVVSPTPPAPSSTMTSAADPRGDAPQPALDFISIGGALDATALRIQLDLAGKPADQLTAYNIFINTDSSPGTGYGAASFQGADYMIQDKVLHRFTGATNTEWKWDVAGAAQVQTTGQQLVYTLPKSAIGGPQSVAIFANSQGPDWQVADWAPGVAALAVGTSSAPAATPQAAAAASSGATVYTDPKGDAGSNEDLVSASAEVVGPDIRFALEVAGTPALTSMHVMIDSDASNATGYSDGPRQGADFMVEGETLYRHDGQPGPNWTWKALGPVKSAASPNRIEITVPRSRVGIGESARINVWFSTTDGSWNAADFLPNQGMEQFPK
jgi:hypothetical protein